MVKAIKQGAHTSAHTPSQFLLHIVNCKLHALHFLFSNFLPCNSSFHHDGFVLGPDHHQYITVFLELFGQLVPRICVCFTYMLLIFIFYFNLLRHIF